MWSRIIDVVRPDQAQQSPENSKDGDVSPFPPEKSLLCWSRGFGADKPDLPASLSHSVLGESGTHFIWRLLPLNVREGTHIHTKYVICVINVG